MLRKPLSIRSDGTRIVLVVPKPIPSGNPRKAIVMKLWLLILSVLPLDVTDDDVQSFIKLRDSVAEQRKREIEEQLKVVETNLKATKKVFLDANASKVQTGEDKKHGPHLIAPNRKLADEFRKELLGKKRGLEEQMKTIQKEKQVPVIDYYEAKTGDVAVFQTPNRAIYGTITTDRGRDASELEYNWRITEFRPKDFERANGLITGMMNQTVFQSNDIGVESFDGKIGRIVRKNSNRVEIYWFSDKESEELKARAKVK